MIPSFTITTTTLPTYIKDMHSSVCVGFPLFSGFVCLCSTYTHKKQTNKQRQHQRANKNESRLFLSGFCSHRINRIFFFYRGRGRKSHMLRNTLSRVRTVTQPPEKREALCYRFVSCFFFLLPLPTIFLSQLLFSERSKEQEPKEDAVGRSACVFLFDSRLP